MSRRTMTSGFVRVSNRPGTIIHERDYPDVKAYSVSQPASFTSQPMTAYESYLAYRPKVWDDAK